MSVRELLSATVAALFLTACGDAFSPESVSGFYELVSINGNALPAIVTTVYEGVPVTGTWSAGSITLSENGTYITSADVTLEVGGVTFGTTVTDFGTYTLVEPSTVQLTGNNAGESAGTLDGNRLTVISGSDSMVFER